MKYLSRMSQVLKEKIEPFKIQLANFKILAINLGQFRSIKNKVSVDQQGEEIPWYTYPAIEYLSQFDYSQKSIFEFGSGSSSIFWAKRAKKVVSVEHDATWYKTIIKKKMKNQEILLLEKKEDYINALKKFNEKFDIVIIDAKYRYECAQDVMKHLNDSGLVILDNSDWYPNVAEFLKNKDLIQVDFSGFGPINNYTWVTTVLLSRRFNLMPLNKQPIHCIGGIKQYANE